MMKGDRMTKTEIQLKLIQLELEKIFILAEALRLTLEAIRRLSQDDSCRRRKCPIRAERNED